MVGLESTERYYSVREAAKLLGLSRGRIHQFIWEGRLPARKIGTVFVIRHRDLERFRLVKRPCGRPKSRS